MYETSDQKDSLGIYPMMCGLIAICFWLANTDYYPVSEYYRNCAAAHADGASPIYKGEAGYRRGLDRDNDGIACEL